jgi:hypothetical protein
MAYMHGARSILLRLAHGRNLVKMVSDKYRGMRTRARLDSKVDSK